ncbi:hypothetical protein ACFC4I_14385 [Enterococcus durans]|jgi:hypothetical protein|uniref:hypothetical protein n=1 Tax=Enterococcus durans TaxID=53345 RepID=UPI0035E32C84
MKNSITKVSLVVSIISLLVVGFLALQMHEQVITLQNVQQQVDDNTNVTDPRQTSWALQNIWVFDNQTHKYVLTHISKGNSKALRDKLLKNQSGMLTQVSITHPVVPFIYVKNNKISYDKLTTKGMNSPQLQRVHTNLTYK